ncbi:ATP-binding cassette protein [Pyrenophora tritici-repentis Pt-1C-BFP]|uniref:ATP-binding cassette protein n=1 Tax=Pyrenophora tritici-repentis (strain Pt-1C-BFP) TaxID=426418 RepID=B2W4U8_PYRTR|nr:ATP-binding cassette protein [Pyrenophora tritici-repentis Pt-1C-BFP]EDU47555.1 ATP-binding cassette protein [Pyrenophora tritici-repentis Pt-1C-BFP]
MAAQSTLRKPHEPLIALYDRYATLLKSRVRDASKLTKILSTITLLFTIIGAGYGGRTWYKSRRAEKETGRRLLRRNSGLKNKDGSRTIYVPYRDSTSKVVIHPTKQTTFDAHRRLFLQPPRAARMADATSSDPQAPPPQTKPGLNLAFLHQFLSLLNIMIPRWNSKETGLLVSHSVFLMLRTYLSLVVARLDGEIVRDLVAGNGKAFLWGIVKWLGVGTFSSYTNAMIKFLQSKVSIAFRTRLTRYIHDLYLNDHLNYYKLQNLDGGVGVGADQYITQDLTLFCASAASLYSSLGKPFVDLCVFNYQLYRSLGPLALTGLLSNYFLTATVLRKLSPPFGKLKAVEGRREGEFRALHSRLIANAEEVAFYGGDEMEKHFLERGFKDLKHWMEGIYSLKIRYNMLEDFVLKYSWSAFGYLVTSLPVFLPAWGGADGTAELPGGEKTHRERSRMKDFITNKRLMLSLADAGTVHKGFDGIRLEHVPVVAPALHPMGGEELLESLSFIVHSGEHLLITGPNGCGKSAVSRIVAGLWPAYRGLVSRPRTIGVDGIMFLPQRPYLSTGTLRDQVIYPHTDADMKDAGRRDFELSQVLEEAKLGYLPDREGGWDTKKVWKDVFSGGEKQRMGIARLLYHEPRYAFVDEGTSAVSSDVEGLLYERAKAKGITLITISTRASLKRYHTYTLTLGMGEHGDEWEFQRIGTQSEKSSVEKELAELRERLEKVEGWKQRKEEIESELNRVWVEKEGEGDGEELALPPYLEKEGDGEAEGGEEVSA